MRRTGQFVGAILVALCLGALFAGAAEAAGSLHLTYGASTKLVPGQEVEGFDTAWSIESSEGNVSCSKFENNEGFLGKDETNDSKADAISVDSVFGTFSTNSECSSTISGFSPTPRGFWLNGNTVNYEVKGKFKLSASGKGEYVTAASKDTVISVQNGESYCFWEAKKLKGTLASLPGRVTVSFSKQKVKLLKELKEAHVKSAASCPKKPTLTTNVAFYVPLGEGEEAALEGSVS